MNRAKAAGQPVGMRRFAVAAAAMATLIGCATITSGSSQVLAIETDPPGAYCVLSRRGETIGVVNPTPGSVSVTKSKHEISVACRKEGYLDEHATIGSSTAAATFGNILLGGLIGIGVDAMSGATSKYDTTSVIVLLVPVSFASSADRDAYFEKVKDRLRERSASKKEAINKTCTSSCDSQLKGVDDQESATLARLDTVRDQSTIKEEAR